MGTNEKNKRRFILLLKKIKKIICYNKIRNRKKNKMNKIHNNLTIENLIKTDSFKQLTVEKKEELLKNSQWFNQFQELQQQEILKGLKANLDISIYAKEEFDWQQMWQIKLGLEKKIDVSIYAKLEYNGNKMEQIRLGLEDNLDVSIYIKPELNEYQMREIRLGLKNNLDVSIYAKSDKYDNNQMKQIRWGLVANLNVFIYAKDYFTWRQMLEIRKDYIKD